MPKYRFSWDAFDDSLVKLLAQDIGYGGTDDGARAWLSDRVKRPNEDFLRPTKQTLSRVWLPNYSGAIKIAEALQEFGIGPMGKSPSTTREAAAYVDRCRNSINLRRGLLEALLRFGDQDRDPTIDGEELFHYVPRFKIMEPKKQGTDKRTPFNYQEEAWHALSAHLSEAGPNGNFQGLLVMPTGSGKTYTTVHWLLENVINRGHHVLWIAHRHELLNQTAREFHLLAGLANMRERIRVRVVSQAHCCVSQIDPEDDVVVCSIASLARTPEILQRLGQGMDLFVVIDEAHHAAAPSYKALIKATGDGRHRQLLGLTATPTRTVEKERPELLKLFGERIIHAVDFRDLVERKFLARPHPIVVKTNEDVERGITEEDRRHLAQFNELSEEWQDRIAGMTRRNETIVHQYLDNRAKYGKTLIFAINVLHAALLANALKNKDVKAEYVASWRPDDEAKDNLAIIQDFRDGTIDVLVNVQILAEGVDVPSAKTAFLTRPTSSEILLRQMIGRVLRGPRVGGNEVAFLVSFEDHWERFRDWENQFDLVPDIVEPVPMSGGVKARKEGVEVAPPPLVEALPWDLIKSVAAEIRGLGSISPADAFEAVPFGWFVLEHTAEGEAVEKVIPVYEHQFPSWDALFNHLSKLSAKEFEQLNSAREFEEYFFDCDIPKPAEHDIRAAIEHFRGKGERPEFHSFDDRKACDPCTIADKAEKENLGSRDLSALVEERYKAKALARAIYPTLRDFSRAIEDALYELRHPEESTRVRRAVPIFDPRSDQMLTPPPIGQHAHDLPLLMNEVLKEGDEILGMRLSFAGELIWTRHIVKGWWAFANWPVDASSGRSRIRVNRLLDSLDISPATIRFLLWHEFLHIFLRQGHTKQFRERERKWPGWIDTDRELNNLNERFGVQYW